MASSRSRNLPEHVRPNRVALVLGQQKPGGAFSGVDVEVVEPEIDEHLLQLPLAVRRAQQLLLGQLDHDLIGAPPILWTGLGLVVRGGLLPRASRPKLRDLELLGNLARRQAQGSEPRETSVHPGVG